MSPHRFMVLSDADREVMRALTLRVVTKLLAGRMNGYAVELFRIAYTVVYDDAAMPELQEGWDEYFTDCMDMLESYRDLKSRPEINKLLQWCRCSDCVTMTENIKAIELAYSATTRRG